MNLYLIRHGQSLGNVGLGGPDPELTDVGREQARLTGAVLPEGPNRQIGQHHNRPIDRLYCSPLRRALETATIISEAIGVGITVRPDLAECGGPRPESMMAPQVVEAFPHVSLDDTMPEGPWWPTEKEDRIASAARAERVKAWIMETWADTDETVVIVSHAVFINFLCNALMNVHPAWALSITFNNCNITRFLLTPERPILICLNEVSHLPHTHQTSGWEQRD